MTVLIAEWWRRLRLLWFRDRATADLEDEMRLHRELRAESLSATGASARLASATAKRQFGNALILQEASRDMWGLGSLDDIRQDLRYAVRRLRQRPGFTLSVVAVLALGIGATTAMFSAVDAAMLRPLPFARPAELVALRNVRVPFDPGAQNRGEPPFHLPDLKDAAAMKGAFSHVAAFAAGGLNLSDPDRPVRLVVGVVTSDFFGTLGIPPAIGRVFSSEEGKPGGPAVAVLSYGLWQQQYGGRDMIQQTILLNNKPYTVIGVMPRGFSFPEQSAVWIPMSVPTTFATFESFRGYLPSRTIARVANGDVAAAERQLRLRWEQAFAAAAPEPGRSYPSLDESKDEIRQKGTTTPLRQVLLGDRRTALLILLSATGLLLLIACANVMNLMLSHAGARRREIAVREVLGASRGRALRQLLTESVVLAAAGAAVGVALAPAAVGTIRALLPAQLVAVAPIVVNLRVLAFAGALAFATAIAFGLWPALGALRAAPAETIKSGGGHGSTTGRAGRARRMLVGAELALTALLLIGAGLMLRSFSRLMGVDRGMNTEQVGTLTMSFPASAGNSVARAAKIDAILDRISAVPGVTAAGAVNDLPLGSEGGISISVEADGIAPEVLEKLPFVRYLMASDGYFKTLGVKLLLGRNFLQSDDSIAPAVVIVNREMADAYWPGINPVGRTLQFPGSRGPATVVGVVANVRERGLDQAPMPQLYFPIRQQAPSSVSILARGALPAARLLEQMTAAVRSVDRTQAVYKLRSMSDVVGASLAPRRTSTMLIAVFAAVALLISALGVYAVVAYSVAQRTREFGIRTALGATGNDLMRHVLTEMALVAGGGIVVGVAAAWGLTQVASSLLYEVTARDLTTFVAAPLILLVPAAVATILPARRTLRVNPAEVMRTD